MSELSHETPRQQRPETARDSRGLLLEAASALFAERGYDRATVRDIASRAGVNQALLFRHFGSKKALFGEVVSLGGHTQLRATPPEQLLGTVLRSVLGEGAGAESGDAGKRAVETLLRSLGDGDEITSVVRDLSGSQARVLATLSTAPDSGLRADLALAWILGIGVLRTVVGKEPLATADPDEVNRLVTSALQTLLENLPPATAPGSDPSPPRP